MTAIVLRTLAETRAQRDRLDVDLLTAELARARRTIAAVQDAAEHLDRALAGQHVTPEVRAAVEQLDRALTAHDTTTPDA